MVITPHIRGIYNKRYIEKIGFWIFLLWFIYEFKCFYIDFKKEGGIREIGYNRYILILIYRIIDYCYWGE